MNCTVLNVLLVLIICITRASSQQLCPKKCPSCPQRFAPCQFGEGYDFCDCCTTCLKDEGEVCGGSEGIDGKCGKDLVCPDYEVTLDPPKVCKRFGAICFVPCIYSPCGPRPSCKFGYTQDFCRCCDVCLPGPGEPCKGRCGTGLDCYESNTGGVCKPRLPITLGTD